MSSAVYIIAEAGVNHNGNLDRALAMVDAAADAQVDAVKFQTFCPEALVTAGAAQAGYQIRNQGDVGSQLTMLRRLVLQPEDHHALMAHCTKRDVDFMSSPFDAGSADFLVNDLQLPCIKLGSGELTNGPLLLQLARSGRELILSTGMATLEEIGEALNVLAFGYLRQDTPSERAALAAAWENPAAHQLLHDRVTLLHCTSEYPCPPDQVNLRAMDDLAEHFGLPVGYSDHTLGISVAVAATARGAQVLEKHFTLDRGLPGPDHVASLEPDQLASLVKAVREVSAALGGGSKAPAAVEAANAVAARKSLVAARPIQAGEAFDATNLTVKRPATGRSPMDYWDLLGQCAARDFAADEVIE